MPIEILETTNGYYIPKSGPWNSEKDKEAYAAAERKFEELKEADLPYVALIESHHEYTKGYWIEIKEKECKGPDILLKEHKHID